MDTKTLTAVVALGIAGFDPLGAVSLVAAMAAGVKRRGVVALAVSTLVGTVGLGVLLSSTLGVWLRHWARRLRHLPHHVMPTVLVVVGLALVAWGVVRMWRARRPVTRAEHEPRAVRRVGVWAMAGSGVLVALSALVDPAFYGLVVVAGGRHHPLHRLVMAAVWTLFSQCLLVVLTIAVLSGRFAPVERWLDDVRARWGRPLGLVLSVLLLVAGLLLTARGVGGLLRP